MSWLDRFESRTTYFLKYSWVFKSNQFQLTRKSDTKNFEFFLIHWWPKTCIECGVTSATSHFNRIVGGADAVANSWPSLAYIAENGDGICGGVLIDRKTVLSAAHCLSDPIIESAYTIYLGVHDRTDLTSASGVIARSVVRISKVSQKIEVGFKKKLSVYSTIFVQSFKKSIWKKSIFKNFVF